ncbi:nuclear transport factor 2 family protein [Parasphingopyxis marina]|uniref:Nuclear transport factor 2 family protein n=1 Tax=Parasphingopyxis marina TaxID=2761622 RepID=A0A842HVN0_9SPHN|nr:nuclear transport factor 2 family protein [Parasphingopyxis marina]MBC2777022.1 nuclear transport factor 2 family protein [Parasphingopyxis marina]
MNTEDMISQSDLQWLIDRMKIRDCLGRYTRGLDRHDGALIASAFWPEAEIFYGKRFEGDLDDFVEWSNASHAERWTQHSHNITNQNVAFDDDRSGADVESYVQFFHRAIGDGVSIGVGRYIDRFEQRGGEWKIISRLLVVDMMLDAEHLDFDASGFPVGKWGEGDPSYSRPFGGPRN